jgi:dihydrodipicolinate synthase/N-acetylneuraminate lyase
LSIEGVFVASITPRREGGAHVDLAAMLELVDHLAGAGVDGIALFGSTGEFLHYDIEERIRVQTLAVKRSRVPVIANVSHSTLDGALQLAREAASSGAAGLLLMPPYFFRYGQAEIAAFFRAFAAEAGPTPPLLLYNIPFFTSPIDAATAIDLLAAGVAQGIKDSSGDWDYFARLRALKNDRPFPLLIGNDVLFARGRAAGADGVVSGVACAAPELMVALNRALCAGSADKAARLDRMLGDFIAWLDRFPTPVGVRLAVEAKGLKVGPHAGPLDGQTRRLAGEFRDWLGSWFEDVKKEVQS